MNSAQATTQAVVGALRTAGIPFSRTETVQTSRPHPRGEVVTTSKRSTDGATVSKSRMGILIEYYGANREEQMTKIVATLASLGFNVQPPKPGGVAVVK
jgi:hypothetical protein